MLQSHRLPQWPPGSYGTAVRDGITRRAAPTPLSDRRQQPNRVREPPAGESVFGGPIFRGGSWGDLEPVSSVESEHSSVEQDDTAGIQRGERESSSKENGITQARVRFDLGKIAVAATWTSNHDDAVGTGAACRKEVQSCQEEEAAGGGEEGGEKYVATDGQCFVVRQRNGMHTAWRLPAPNRSNTSSNPTTVATVHNSSSIARATPPTIARWEQSASADRLISPTTSSSPQQQEHQQHPARLFLRRTRASPSSSATNAAETAAAMGALSGTGVGSSVDSQAFSLPWVGSRSPVGNSKESSSVQLSDGGARTGAQEGIEGLSVALTNRRHASPASSREQQQQQQRRGTSSRTGAPGGPPLRRLASRKASPRHTTCSRGGPDDENSPPPPAGTARVSSPAVRQNLARAARKSKVGTKADPVTLYRQRQEQEQARIKNVVARNRKKASREGRPGTADGFARGSGRAAGTGTGTGTGTAVDRRRTRAAGSVVGRVGICLR